VTETSDHRRRRVVPPTRHRAQFGSTGPAPLALNFSVSPTVQFPGPTPRERLTQHQRKHLRLPTTELFPTRRSDGPCQVGPRLTFARGCTREKLFASPQFAPQVADHVSERSAAAGAAGRDARCQKLRLQNHHRHHLATKLSMPARASPSRSSPTASRCVSRTTASFRLFDKIVSIEMMEVIGLPAACLSSVVLRPKFAHLSACSSSRAWTPVTPSSAAAWDFIQKHIFPARLAAPSAQPR
jgi:hypothetical protein